MTDHSKNNKELLIVLSRTDPEIYEEEWLLSCVVMNAQGCNRKGCPFHSTFGKFCIILCAEIENRAITDEYFTWR